MTDPEILAYARQAFGDNPAAVAFYLRELAHPGEFDRLFAALLVQEKAQPIERLHPAEERTLARARKSMRDAAHVNKLQSKHDLALAQQGKQNGPA